MITKVEATKYLLETKWISETARFIYAGEFHMHEGIMELDYPKKGRQADQTVLKDWTKPGAGYITTKTLIASNGGKGEEIAWDIGCTGRSPSGRISSYRGDPDSKPKKEGDKGDGASNLAMRSEVRSQEGRAIYRWYYLSIPSSMIEEVDIVTGRKVSVIDINAARRAEKALTELFIELTGARLEGQGQIG